MTKLLRLVIEETPGGTVFSGLEEGILAVSAEELGYVLMAFHMGALYPYDCRCVGRKIPQRLFYVEVYERTDWR